MDTVDVGYKHTGYKHTCYKNTGNNTGYKNTILENGCHISLYNYADYKNIYAVPDDVLITGIHCICNYNLI